MIPRVVLAVLAGTLALTALAGRSAAPRQPSAADERYVVVLERHLRHEAELAGAATQRAADEAGRALAATVRDEATKHADEVTATRRAWALTDADAARIFVAATDGRVEVTGTPVFACSLHGPVDDIGQVGAVDASRVSARWAQLAMTSTIEGLQLTRAADGAIGGAAQSARIRIDAWQRSVLARLTPLLPASDRSYASAQAAVGA